MIRPVVWLSLLPAAWLTYSFLLRVGWPHATPLGALVPADLPAFAYGKGFSSMLTHMLAGRFDVDASTVGIEGFALGDRVYAYFGIVPAMVRLLFRPFVDFDHVDLTRLSMLTAVCLAATLKLATALRVLRLAHPAPGARTLAFWVVITILLGTPQVAFLSPSIYQEPESWAAVFAAAFVYFAIDALASGGGFSRWRLAGMALSAGLALLTRITFGVGLYAALLLLLGVLLADRRRAGSNARDAAAVLVPLGVLAVFAAAFLAVNDARWGDAFTLAPLEYQQQVNAIVPDRMARVRTYGTFNPQRVGFSLLYYFLPIWAVKLPDGSLPFAAFRHRLYEICDLPPSSFLLTDPLLLLLAGVFVVRAWRGRRDASGAECAIAAGLSVPVVLMLSFMTLAFRYRLEFYPLLEFMAFLGLIALFREAEPARIARMARWSAIAAPIGILAAQLAFVTNHVLVFLLRPDDELQVDLPHLYYWEIARFLRSSV